MLTSLFPGSPFQVTLTIDDATLAPLSVEITNDDTRSWVFSFGHPNQQAQRTFTATFTPGQQLTVNFPPGIRNTVVWGNDGPYRYSAGPL